MPLRVDRRTQLYRRSTDRRPTPAEYETAVNARQEELLQESLTRKGLADTKRCVTCKRHNLPLSMFSKDKRRSDGLNQTCRDCAKVSSKKYAAKMKRKNATAGNVDDR